MKLFSDPAHPVKADAAARGGAMLVDCVAVALAVAVVDPPDAWRFVAAFAIAFAWFAGFPLTRLSGTPGKWIARVRICDRTGTAITPRQSVLRAGATLAWLAVGVWTGPQLPDWAILPFWLVFVLPWMAMGVTRRGESLFDLLAGTRVVRMRATAATIAAHEPAPPAGWKSVAGTALLWVLIGVFAALPLNAYRDRDRRVRIAYAYAETEALRKAIEGYHQREKRWPAAEALGAPAWTPYPAGGGYALEAAGRIRIRFEKMPELKDRGIVLTPRLADDGKRIEWTCATYAGLEPRWVPAFCR